MIDNDLRTTAHRALSEARDELEKHGNITPVFQIQMKKGWTRLDVPREFADLMNIGDAKQAIFDFVRAYAHANGATGVVFVSDTWMGRPTEKAKGLDKDEFLRLYREHGMDGLEKLGLSTRVECITITAQSLDAVIVLHQPYERHKRIRLITFAPVDEHEVPQSQFAGRQKMFGDLRKENIQ